MSLDNQEAMASTFQRFFSPRAIAVLGASPSPNALSRRFISGLIRHGYTGRIVPINPHHDSVDGIRCFPSLAEAENPNEIDIAVLSIPAANVPAALEECAAAGLCGVHIFTSGFGEIGASGAEAQRRLVESARRLKLRILGPNSPGFINFTDSIALIALGVGFRSTLIRGGLGLVAQSGGVGGLICEQAQDAGVGFSRFICIGNEADISTGELLRWYAADPETHFVAVYIEGIRDPADLVSGLDALARQNKPVVVLKAASTELVARATSAHTGVLATSDDVFDAVLARYGGIRVHGVSELVDVTVALERLKVGASKRVGLISTSGGAGVLATQAAERAGIELPKPMPETHERLARILPDYASSGNPGDMSGAFNEHPEIFRDSIAAYCDDPQYDAVVVILTVQPPPVAERLALNLIEFARSRTRPPAVLWIAGEMSAAARSRLREAGLAVFEDADRCMRALAARACKNPLEQLRASSPGTNINLGNLENLPAGQVSDDEALELLARCGIPVPPMHKCATTDDARGALRELGRVAVKAVGLAHKASAGGLVLDITTDDEIAQAHTRVAEAAARAGGEPAYTIVQQLAPSGLELIIGARRDPGFGVILVVGLGGSTAELCQRVSRRLLPLTEGESAEMLHETGLWDVLANARPSAPLETAAAIQQLADLAQAIGDRLEAVEVNPLIVHSGTEGVSAVDVLLLLRDTQAVQSHEKPEENS